MIIDRIDHLVLTVADIGATCEFYARTLGMDVVTFGDDRKALAFGHQKINLHQVGRELEPKAGDPTPGSADLCLITLMSMDDVVDHLRRHGVAIVEGPVPRPTATGEAARSIYFRDPDGNLVELMSTE